MTAGDAGWARWLRLTSRRFGVVPGHKYAIAGVLNAGKGLFRRENIDGTQTNYAALHRLRTGQLVMRKLTAWEGPITCVPRDFDGCFVSAEFPTFTLAPDLLPEFMSLVCQQPVFWEAMKGRSTGSVQRRKRVSPSELLAIEIDLPSRREQRRITDLIHSVDALLAAAAAAAEANSLVRGAVLSELVAAGDEVKLGSLVELEYGRGLPAAERTGRGFPVFGAAGIVGRHDPPTVGAGPVNHHWPRRGSTLRHSRRPTIR